MTTFGKELRGKKHVFDMQGVKRVLEHFQRRAIDVIVITKRQDGASYSFKAMSIFCILDGFVCRMKAKAMAQCAAGGATIERPHDFQSHHKGTSEGHQVGSKWKNGPMQVCAESRIRTWKST